jgi:hypothetical protein
LEIRVSYKMHADLWGGYSHHSHHSHQAGHPLPRLTSAPNKHTVALECHYGIQETPLTYATRCIDTLIEPILCGFPTHCYVITILHAHVLRSGSEEAGC